MRGVIRYWHSHLGHKSYYILKDTLMLPHWKISLNIMVLLGTIQFYTDPPKLMNRLSSSSWAVTWSSHRYPVWNSFIQHQIPTVYTGMIWRLDYSLNNPGYYSAQCFAVSVSFLCFLGILPEWHYYHGLKYSVVSFSYESSFLHFRIVSLDFMNYLLTPVLFKSVASARVVWLSVTPVTSTIGLLCELNYGQSLYNKTSKLARNVYYNEGISISKRFPL